MDSKEFFEKEYEAYILAYRRPGKDNNSKQIFYGDVPSVLTMMTSMLESLLRKGVLNEDALKEMVELAIKGSKGELE